MQTLNLITFSLWCTILTECANIVKNDVILKAELLKSHKLQNGLLLEKENIYQQRIVLLPSKSYLVFTPLPEHQGKIFNVK